MASNKDDWADKLEDLSYGLGEGLANQARGIGQLVMHPIDSGVGMYEGVKALIKDPSLAKQAAIDLYNQAKSSPQGLGQVIGENVSPAEWVRGLGALSKPVMREIKTYHGTGHTWPTTDEHPLGRIDPSKIGTGEGHAAYSYGFYSGEDPRTGLSYRDMLTKRDPQMLAATKAARDVERASAARGSPISKQEVKSILQSRSEELADNKELLDYLHQVSSKASRFDPEWATVHKEIANIIKPGNLYHLDIPDEKVNRMMHWDIPIEYQPEHVQKSLAPLLEKYKPEPSRTNEAFARNISGVGWTSEPPPKLGPAGDDLYYAIWNEKRDELMANPEYQAERKRLLALGSDSPNRKDLLMKQFRVIEREADIHTTNVLKSHGIPGVQYQDSGSRQFAPPFATRNFVVFPGEEKDVQVLKRGKHGDSLDVSEELKRKLGMRGEDPNFATGGGITIDEGNPAKRKRMI